MDKPKPRARVGAKTGSPYRRIPFNGQPGDTDLPEDRVGRNMPEKISSASLRSTAGASITAAGAARETSKVLAPQTKGKGNVFSKFGDIVPYMSNIANSFRKPPMPTAPGSIAPVSTSRVSADNQLYETDRAIRGANMGADRNLDENTAAAVKGSNMAQGIRGRNAVYESVNNANADMENRTRQVNAGIQAQNIGMTNQYNNDKVGAQIAQQREQSENLSNAADKYVGQQQFNDAQDLDMRKLEAMKPLWKRSGVFDRTYPQAAAGGEIGDPPISGFRDLSGTGSAVANSAGMTMNAANNLTQNGYSWDKTNTAGWEDYPVKDAKIGYNDWRKPAFPDKQEFMKTGTQFQYMIKNMPYNNAYQHQFQHHSTAPVVPGGKMSDKPMVAAYGGRLRKRVY